MQRLIISKAPEVIEPGKYVYKGRGYTVYIELQVPMYKNELYEAILRIRPDGEAILLEGHKVVGRFIAKKG